MSRWRIAFVYAALLAVSAAFLFPFYWVVASSLMSVEGMNLTPPALYPAEAKTVSLTAPPGGRLVESDGSTWFRLAGSPDLLAASRAMGAYYVRLDPKGVPSQLVAWLPEGLHAPKSKPPAQIRFEKVPVHRTPGGDRAIVAKMVRQSAGTFDELLFTAPPADGALTRTDVLRNVPHTEIRSFRAHWENYGKALAGPEASIGGKSTGFLLFLRNSLFVSTMALIGQVLAGSLVAFGFARLRFRGRDTLFLVLIATLMVPAQVTLIPLFTIYKTLGWIDTFLPLIVPHFTAGAFNVFLIRQFLLTVPKELDESAAIDGAGPFRVYWSVILPLCSPVLIVVGLFTFVATWQDVMGPLIYLDDPAKRTVTLGLEYFRSPYVDNRPLLMAGAVLSILPVAFLFLLGQRYILSGIATTGLK